MVHLNVYCSASLFNRILFRLNWWESLQHYIRLWFHIVTEKIRFVTSTELTMGRSVLSSVLLLCSLSCDLDNSPLKRNRAVSMHQRNWFCAQSFNCCFCWISEVGNLRFVPRMHQMNWMGAQVIYCCYCLDLLYWKRSGLYASEELNVCTKHPLLFLLGSRKLGTYGLYLVCIRRTECVHKASIVDFAWICVGNVVVFVHQRNWMCVQGIHNCYCLDLGFWQHNIIT
jgi:hypothetical protein